MTKQQKLEIEKQAYQEVIKQFTSHPDARMNCQLNEFLSTIEVKIREINHQLQQLESE